MGKLNGLNLFGRGQSSAGQEQDNDDRDDDREDDAKKGEGADAEKGGDDKEEQDSAEGSQAEGDMDDDEDEGKGSKSSEGSDGESANGAASVNRRLAAAVDRLPAEHRDAAWNVAELAGRTALACAAAIAHCDAAKGREAAAMELALDGSVSLQSARRILGKMPKAGGLDARMAGGDQPDLGAGGNGGEPADVAAAAARMVGFTKAAKAG